MFAATKSSRGENWGAWNVGKNAWNPPARTLDLDGAYRRLAAVRTIPSQKSVQQSIDAARAQQPGVTGAAITSETGPAGGVFDAATGAVEDIKDGLVPWADGLGKVLSVLGSAEWWRRIGVGALGVVLVVAMIALYNKDAVTRGVVQAAIPG